MSLAGSYIRCLVVAYVMSDVYIQLDRVIRVPGTNSSHSLFHCLNGIPVSELAGINKAGAKAHREVSRHAGYLLHFYSFKDWFEMTVRV